MSALSIRCSLGECTDSVLLACVDYAFWLWILYHESVDLLPQFGEHRYDRGTHLRINLCVGLSGATSSGLRFLNTRHTLVTGGLPTPLSCRCYSELHVDGGVAFTRNSALGGGGGGRCPAIKQ